MWIGWHNINKKFMRHNLLHEYILHNINPFHEVCNEHRYGPYNTTNGFMKKILIHHHSMCHFGFILQKSTLHMLATIVLLWAIIFITSCNFIAKWVKTWCAKPNWMLQTLFLQHMKFNRRLHDNLIEYFMVWIQICMIIYICSEMQKFIAITIGCIVFLDFYNNKYVM